MAGLRAFSNIVGGLQLNLYFNGTLAASGTGKPVHHDVYDVIYSLAYHLNGH